MSQQMRILAIFPFLFVFYEITTYLANDMYLPALPTIAHELSTSRHYAQMTLTTWFLGTAAFQLILGPLSDRVGRRPIIFAGGLVYIIASLICALTSNIVILLIARFFQGSVVSSITAGYSAIHELYDQKKAIHVLAIIGSIVVLAPSFGPLLGALVLQGLSWRWIFGILTIWGLIALILLWIWMPESNPKENRHPLQWKTIGKNYVNLILNSHFMLNVLLFCFTFLGLITWIAAGPFLIIQEFKFSTLMFGVFQILVFGTWIVGSQLVKYFMEKVGVQNLVNIGLIILFGGGIFGVILTACLPHFIWGIIIAFMIFAFGSSLTYSTSQRLAIEACTEPMGARLAVLSLLMYLFGVLGTLLVTLTYTGTLFWLAVLLLIVAILASCMRLIERKIPV